MPFRRLTYGVILAGAGAWCALILLAPLLRSRPLLAPFGAFVYAFFAPLCHQIGARSFHLAGEQLAVCARCASIYFGFLAGALLYPLLEKRAALAGRGADLLLAAAAPMACEVLAEVLGLTSASNVIRAATGGWFGLLLPLVIIPGALEGVSELMAGPNPPLVQPEKGHSDA